MFQAFGIVVLFQGLQRENVKIVDVGDWIARVLTNHANGSLCLFYWYSISIKSPSTYTIHLTPAHKTCRGPFFLRPGIG